MNYISERFNAKKNVSLVLAQRGQPLPIFYSIVHSLLDEIVNSAVHRCIHPTLMEPSVSLIFYLTQVWFAVAHYLSFFYMGYI